MGSMFGKIRSNVSKRIKEINRTINYKMIKRKTFCIGLHKTGTSSLFDLALKYGYFATHSTGWDKDPAKIKKFDFFCDGGSHFDGQKEFDVKHLFYTYPESKFILQTRDTKIWIVSKLKHAGWKANTPIEPDKKSNIKHSEWTYKSLLNIDKLIEHKYNYEKKLVRFFEDRDPYRLIIIDITDKEKQHNELKRLIKYLGLYSINRIKLPHNNKTKAGSILSEEVLCFIDEKIAKLYAK